MRAHGLTDPTLTHLSASLLSLILMWNNTLMSCSRWGCFEMLCRMVSRRGHGDAGGLRASFYNLFIVRPSCR